MFRELLRPVAMGIAFVEASAVIELSRAKGILPFAPFETVVVGLFAIFCVFLKRRDETDFTAARDLALLCAPMGAAFCVGIFVMPIPWGIAARSLYFLALFLFATYAALNVRRAEGAFHTAIVLSFATVLVGFAFALAGGGVLVNLGVVVLAVLCHVAYVVLEIQKIGDRA